MKPSTRINHSTSSASDIQLFLGLVLAIASTGAMVMTMQSLVNGWIAKSLTICAGIALQGCLYLFSNNSNHRIRWFSYLLLVFSVIATTWFMDTTWQQQQYHRATEQNQQANQSWQATQIRQQIEELNREINISTTSAEIDIGANYRDRGNSTMSELDRKKLARNELMAELKNHTGAAPQLTGKSIFEETAQLRIGLFAFISLIIDLSAILAFGALPKPAPKEPSQPKPENSQPDYQPNQERTYTAPTTPQPEAPQEDRPDYLGDILARIRAGDYGEFVPVKQIVESEPVRHPELKAGIDQLIMEGVLSKSGNRYRHTGFEKQSELCMG